MLRIETKDLEAELTSARGLVAVSRIPDTLASVDCGAFGTTPLNLEASDALAQAAAVALAASRRPKPPTPLQLAFLFAEEAADRLGAISDHKEPIGGSGLPASQYSDLASKTAEETLRTVLRDCANFLRFYSGHADAAKRLHRDTEALLCLRSYFALISQTLPKLQEEDPEFALETPRLRFSGWRAVTVGAEEPSELLPVTFDDIVGNAEYVKAGKRLARDVAGFDLKAGKNPKNVRNQVLFVLGTPGCGKTVTAHAIGRYFLSLCEKGGLPGRMRVIRRTDWASAYQNQSASRLLEIFKSEVFGAPGVCGVYWPDIDTAFAARSDQDMRQEEKVNLGTLFGILDGTIGPKNGKWFLICDANTLHMDDATLSRLTQTPLEARGPVTPEDFVKLMRDVKLRGKDAWLPVSGEEWQRLGERCVVEKLSGRSIDSLAGRILTEMEDFDEPDDYFKLSFEEKQKMIAQLSRKVDAARIQTLITEHCKFERDAQAKSESDKFSQRVQEIRFHLSAERAALQTFSQAPPAA